MAEKIGFLTLTYFDPQSPTEYDAYKKLERRLVPNGHVKTLAETHPPLPPIRHEPVAMDRTPDARVYKLASELVPWMDEYHHHALDVSRMREQVKYIERYRFNNDIAELKHYRHVDLLHAWITELLFERVYHRTGRWHQMYEKVAKHEWRENLHFFAEHRMKRVAEAKVFPTLHQKEMVHPYRFEVKEPNEKKGLQKGQDHILEERRVMEHAKTHMIELRQLMTDMLFDEIRMHLRHQFIEKRNSADERSRWHMHDVLRAFDKAWMHAWDSKDTFKQLVRRGVFEQAELYPRLFRKAIRDPYEIEIREPNQKDIHQKIQEHMFKERQFLKLVKLEDEAARQITQNHKIELDSYRLLNKDRLDKKLETRELEQHLLIERKDKGELETRDHIADARRVESQGYQLLAGRMVPQPKFGITTDAPSSVPLPLGVKGDPKAPEYVVPTKVHTVPTEELVKFMNERKDNWHDRTQVIRQNMAAMEYGEQKNKEWVRPILPADPIKPAAETQLHPKITQKVEKE